jgi:hypothetical protein
MSSKQWKERQQDQHSRRRRLLDTEGRKEFDKYYGKQKPTSSIRNSGGAGKGDTQRPCDKELFDLGWEAAFGKTPEIRAAAAKRQQELLRQKHASGSDSE